MLIIEAQRMAQNVANLLVKRETWRVHSVFTNGFNLENKDERIFIGTAKNGQLPFAIQLTMGDVTKLIATIQVNQTFRYEGGILFHQQFQLTLTGATQYTSKREKTEIRLNPTFLIRIVQSERQTGLGVSIQEWLTQAEARNLAKAINSTDSAFIEQTLRYFIGRGNGLTPSGDDILLGILLVGQESTTFKEVLSKLIQTELLTTDISQTYLKYALQDQFSDTLLALYEAFQTGAETKDIVERVYQNGHTSGIDTIAGVALAIKEEFSMGKRVVIALGGNAILQPNQEATFENQLKKRGRQLRQNRRNHRSRAQSHRDTWKRPASRQYFTPK